MKHPHFAFLLRFAFFAGLATVFSGLVYVIAQQDLRHSANDPQVQMAEDAQNAMTQGEAIKDVVPDGRVDLTYSLAPFMVIFNDKGVPIAGNAELDGRLPKLPLGVFDYVRTYGQDRVTWQPDPDLRFAAVITRYVTSDQEGFVLVARSLRETEERIGQLTFQVMAAWIASMLLIIIFVPLIARVEVRKK